MKQSPYLDMLRAVAAFWVLCAHCLIWSDNGVFAPDPKLAVDVFMILSGVLMARTARPGVWRFYVRRFLRIAPAYYAALALAVLCAPWFLGGYQALYDAHPLGATYNPARTTYTLPNLAIHASLLFGVLPRYSFATMLPDWSLSLEWQFYLACPALLWLWRRVPWSFGVLVLACAALTFLGARYPEPSFLPLKLPYFLIGIAVAQARIPLPALPAPRFWRIAADLSYAVYLFHGFCIAACGWYGLPLILAIPASYAVAVPVHLLIERPFLRRYASSNR